MTQDSFTILELISQSPTTSVYKAHQNVLDRTILLKVLHKHLLRDRELVSRFSREAKACAILKSENIVQVYDLTEVDGAPAIVMEYVEGKSLEDTLADKNACSEDLLLRVASSVLKALSYAHDRGVTHRDIKPGNILVSSDGTIKVTDFGLAAVSDAPSLTMEGSLIGTPAYMSPEQARGETVDQRTDIFSLGVTLVEVLTGEKILAGRSYAECIHRIQTFNVSSIAFVSERCSPHVYEFLKRMLEPDKYKRFTSASEALGYLGHVPAGEPEGANAVVPPRKPRITLFLAGGAAVLAALVIALSSILKHQNVNVTTPKSDSTSVDSSNPVAERKSPVISEARPENSGASGGARLRPAAPGTVTKESAGTSSSLNPDTVLAAAPDTGSDSGYVSIKCYPWAKIYIDSEYAGTTPIYGSIRIPVGRHTVTFNNSNFVPIVKQVNIRKDSLTDVTVNFAQNSGYLVVTVEPWGRVYVDDQFRETTPSAQPIIVSAGTRKIRIQNPGYSDIVKTVTVDPGDTLKLNFDFKSPDGK